MGDSGEAVKRNGLDTSYALAQTMLTVPLAVSPLSSSSNSSRVESPVCLQPSPPCAVPIEDHARWFNEEIHPHGSQLRAWLRGQFPTVRDVDDVVQESYLRVWKAKTTQSIQSGKAFLFTVARHLALNVLRRDRRSPLVEGEFAVSGVLDDRPSVADSLSEQEKIELLTDALAALPARTREIILLHKFDGLTQSETARRLGFTEKAVQHQVTRGIALCTRFIQSRGHDHF